MTREEKVNLLNKLLEIEKKNDIGNLTSTDRREFQQWVEDLEQESTLDKIRTEIKAMFPPSGIWMYDEGHEVEHTVCEVLSDVLQIIDKYKEGAEE